jgi:hypothetical protein
MGLLAVLCLPAGAGIGAQTPAASEPAAQPPALALPAPPASLKQHPRTDPCADQRQSENPEAVSAQTALHPCLATENPYKRFLDSTAPHPLTPAQKAHLAARDVLDPFNILTITGNAAVTVAIDSHTAYGPGFHGFAYDTGVGFSQDVTGEFIGTFLVCSIFHEDPHYHREPDKPVLHRIVHAIDHTVIAQHDDGHTMPNFQNLITFPAAAEIGDLYVPGIATNLPSTVDRVIVGLATDPINNLITEFLPDVAKRIHVRIVFVQQILNQVAAPSGTASGLP